MTDLAAPASVLVDDDLAAALGTATAEEWRRDRGPHQPRVHVVRADGHPLAALLTSRRPATAALKIAGTWHAAGAEPALKTLVEEVVAEAATRGDVAVKWQTTEDADLPGLPARLGFQPMRAPYRSAAGTEGVQGHVRWLRPVPHVEPAYYAQTRSYTCGAVTALLASEIRGSAGFGADAGDRDRELDFWRRASNYPACEPVGLGVALRTSLDDGPGAPPVEVFLDTDGPALLEAYPDGYDRAFRQELQDDSRRRAQELDIPLHRDRLAIDDLAERLGTGHVALLLIDCEPMYGFPAPHWVLAHAAGDGVVLLADPWISATWGETWVDTHELPVTFAELDRMVAWGPDRYRGAVLLHPTT